MLHLVWCFAVVPLLWDLPTFVNPFTSLHGVMAYKPSSPNKRTGPCLELWSYLDMSFIVSIASY